MLNNPFINPPSAASDIQFAKGISLIGVLLYLVGSYDKNEKK